MNASEKIKAGTFTLNKNKPIHRWYEYVEGYSSCLVTEALDKALTYGLNIQSIYDPFGGTGTTALVSSMRGIKPYYSETNPFMQFVIDTKINGVQKLCAENKIKSLIEYMERIRTLEFSHFDTWDGFEKFFEPEQLDAVLSIKAIAKAENNRIISDILMLALSSIIVKASKMVRRGDLRYATEKEYHREDIRELFISKLDQIIYDIEHYGPAIKQEVIKICDDARDNDEKGLFDIIITSPPYLNGTNYIRNTKLELKLNDFIVTEKDLPVFHSKGITAGINNVSKRCGYKPVLKIIKPYIEQITPVAYDERIPKMIVGYFYDMSCVIEKLKQSLKRDGEFVMDIGDSQFAGIHIPTHDILSDICIQNGFVKTGEDILRQRKSKNGMILSQRLLKFKLEV